MKLTLAIPIYKCLHQAKGILGYLKYMTSDEVEWLIIDNASNEDVDIFVHKYLKPKRLNFIKNNQNLGLVKTYQQIYENCQTDFNPAAISLPTVIRHTNFARLLR